jgi:hypothetical protein
LAKATAWRNAILDALLGNQALTLPGSTLYLSLYTVAPTEDGGGTECSGGAYARVAVTNDLTTWPAAEGGGKANGITLSFPTPTATWGTVEAWGLHDHITDDSLVLWDLLDSEVVIDTGDTVEFAAGDLSFDEV